MRRADGLVALSRRQFCGGLATCLGLATLSGCVDGDISPVSTGPLGAGSSNEQPDASVINPPDGGVTASCPASGVSDVGAASTFVANTPTYFSTGKFFVVRDAGGLYAVSSRCTHQNATNNVSSGRFRCPRHGALFTFDGAIISGPVNTGLAHFSICLLPNGHVGVDRSTVVDKTVRLVA